ncbi:hypothetical protein OIO90_005799 [Microbotryomycetes sp. JL221]|nr:hypothetical protein OIO90_005799 [Microbotryomycetes sp. JL221]
MVFEMHCEMRDEDCIWHVQPKGAGWMTGEAELAAAQAEVLRLRSLVDLLMMRLNEVDGSSSAYGIVPPSQHKTLNSTSATAGADLTRRSTLPQPQFPLPPVGYPGLSFIQGLTYTSTTPAESTSSGNESESSRAASEEWQEAAVSFTNSTDWASLTSNPFTPVSAGGLTSARPGDIYVAHLNGGAGSPINGQSSAAGAQQNLSFNSFGSAGLSQYHLM